MDLSISIYLATEQDHSDILTQSYRNWISSPARFFSDFV